MYKITNNHRFILYFWKNQFAKKIAPNLLFLGICVEHY